MKFILSFFVLTLSVMAQQPNNINAELNDTMQLSSACPTSVAGFPRCLNTFGLDPVDFYVGGQPNQYFDLYLAVNPLVMGAIPTQYGIIDIDMSIAVSLYAGYLNGQGLMFFSVPASALPISYILSLQAIVIDPSHPFGARLTGALEFTL